MNAKTIFKKTMPFVWAKLLMGAVMLAAAVILLGILVALPAWLFGNTGGVIGFIVWLIVICTGYSLAMRYFGYLIKAGHVAVIAEACTTGKIPENMIDVGKEKVKNRFTESSVYFLVDSLVSRAVSQLQQAVGKIGGMLDSVPGVGALTGFAKTFIGISLGYIDECCLGWCFLHDDETTFKSSCDGVVIYFQNWKHLLKSAAITSLVVIGVSFAAFVLPLLILGGIFKAFGWNMLIAVIISLIISFIIKTAFVDSWMMVKMMCSYMEVAPHTEISFSLYDKLCHISSSFKKLFNRAKESIIPTEH